MLGNGHFARLKELYSMFRETLCPLTLQVASYAAQYIVSKKKTLENSYTK